MYYIRYQHQFYYRHYRYIAQSSLSVLKYLVGFIGLFSFRKLSKLTLKWGSPLFHRIIFMYKHETVNLCPEVKFIIYKRSNLSFHSNLKNLTYFLKSLHVPWNKKKIKFIYYIRLIAKNADYFHLIACPTLFEAQIMFEFNCFKKWIMCLWDLCKFFQTDDYLLSGTWAIFIWLNFSLFYGGRVWPD